MYTFSRVFAISSDNIYLSVLHTDDIKDFASQIGLKSINTPNRNYSLGQNAWDHFSNQVQTLTFQTPSPPLVQYYETTTTQALAVGEVHGCLINKNHNMLQHGFMISLIRACEFCNKGKKVSTEQLYVSQLLSMIVADTAVTSNTAIYKILRHWIHSDTLT
jgi:hypothetical protein